MPGLRARSEPYNERVSDAARGETSCGAARRDRGRIGYHAGVSAEHQVETDYARRGYDLERRRWRGAGGEIDLIMRDGDGLVFVEVKKSRSFERALTRLGGRQIARLISAAEEFLGTQPRGALTEVRFDVAVLDGHGQIRVLENAITA
ncbi:YraN family protein [Cognatishimia sp. F0-27]|nr:YraN family protein [Cognatishimia sp. F0-27]MCC1493957.1 YraN family protein [Cognatishimia sp. F0-27]